MTVNVWRKISTSIEKSIEISLFRLKMGVYNKDKESAHSHEGKHENRIEKREKTTIIEFDGQDPVIHIRAHNTGLKKRLAAYAERHPDDCKLTDADTETGGMEFEIAKGRFSFRLTAPYSAQRREAARKFAREYNTAERLK